MHYVSQENFEKMRFQHQIWANSEIKTFALSKSEGINPLVPQRLESPPFSDASDTSTFNVLYTNKSFIKSENWTYHCQGSKDDLPTTA